MEITLTVQSELQAAINPFPICQSNPSMLPACRRCAAERVLSRSDQTQICRRQSVKFSCQSERKDYVGWKRQQERYHQAQQPRKQQTNTQINKQHTNNPYISVLCGTSNTITRWSRFQRQIGQCMPFWNIRFQNRNQFKIGCRIVDSNSSIGQESKKSTQLN